MSASNGVIRVGRKGRKKFAIGEEDDPRQLPVFEVDVVVAFQEWVCIDDEFRQQSEDRRIATNDMPAYHAAALEFVKKLALDGSTEDEGNAIDGITTAEALDFIARLRECYDEVAVFFQPKSRDEPDSPATSEAGLRFSVEGSES